MKNILQVCIYIYLFKQYKMLKIAINGCNNEVKFNQKPVYYNWSEGIEKSTLGNKLDKIEYLKSLLTDQNKINLIIDLFSDWELYENGWLVNNTNNPRLFYYLSQIGNYGYNRPTELNYLNK